MTGNIFIHPDGIKINRSIPRTMTEAGLHYLGRLARTVPQDGTIVEIGPLYGSSTWVLSKNCHPSVTVVSLDTWEPSDWITNRLPEAPEFGIEAFLHFTKDCPNIEAIQGWSPDIVASTWNRKIDLFFDDATHGDPGFSKNVNFFLPFVGSNGILSGDDYASGWPDIINVVNDLARRWGVSTEVSGRVWSMLKNGGKDTNINTVAEKIGPWSNYDVVFSCKTQRGLIFTGQPHMWTGQIMKNDPLIGLGIHPVGSESIEGTMSIWLSDGRQQANLSLGCRHDFDLPITNFSVELSGQYSNDISVSYQCCELQSLNAHKTINSRNSRDGKTISKNDDTHISAVRIEILVDQPI